MNHTVRKITLQRIVTTLAGSVGDPGSADGTGLSARFRDPAGVAVDDSGNVYVADRGNHTIRKITSAGIVTTYAGVAGAIGHVDGIAGTCSFNGPSGVAVDGDSLYVADTGNHTIRKITSAGVVTTFAGSPGLLGGIDGTAAAARFSRPTGIAVNALHELYVADTDNHTVRKVSPLGVVTTLAGAAGISGFVDARAGADARFSSPRGVTVDGADNIYVADTGNGTIRLITRFGFVINYVGNPNQPGNADGYGSGALFTTPVSVATRPTGTGPIYVADQGSHTIRMFTSDDGLVMTLAGKASTPGSTDGVGTGARFQYPLGIAVQSSGSIYVADSQNYSVRMVTLTGVVTTLAGTLDVPGTADGAGVAARFGLPCGLAVDGVGNVFLTDGSAGTIRKITAAGVVTTFAGSAFQFGSIDGTGSAARFIFPYGVALDSAGNLFVTDISDYTIRKITPSGVVTTLAGSTNDPGSADGTGAAARFYDPSGVAIDGTNNLFVADSGNHTIRKITPAGVVTTIAGTPGAKGSTDGTGAAARFNDPRGIAVDATGNLYVADSDNHTIRMITPAGVVTTVAGSAGVAGTADGSATDVRFNSPVGIAVDGTGNLYIADWSNHTIRFGLLQDAPTITTHPLTQAVTAGGALTLSVGASSNDSSLLTYQWYHDDVAIAGATSTTLTIASTQSFNRGSYTCVVTANNSSVTSTAATITVSAPPTSDARLMNLSTRALSATGDGLLIPGFVITGPGTKRVLIRGIGPTLGSFGVGGTLADPQMILKSGSTTIAANDDWGSNTSKALIISTSAAVGAFTLLDGSKDAALLLDLAAGAYTVPTAGVAGSTGIGMVELYDADVAPTATLVNISNRGFVGIGDAVMIPGIVVSSEGSRTLLIRAVGPTLVEFGVSGTLADPVLTVFKDKAPILTNDDWGNGSADTATVAQTVGAFPLATGSKDAAFVVTLPPGPYTIQATGKAGTTGIALVEVYLVP